MRWSCFLIQVDLVEPVSHFLEAAREKLATDKDNSDHKALNFYCVPLQVCFLCCPLIFYLLSSMMVLNCCLIDVIVC